jgi:hypothetical protein
LTVNQLVVGSIPTAGANKIKHLGDAAARCELLKHSIGTVFEHRAVLSDFGLVVFVFLHLSSGSMNRGA